MCRQLGLAALHRGGVQGVQPPVLREPLELADTQIDELQPASSHELADRGTDQHLPGTGLGHHPRRQVDPDAGRRITAELHLAGVEPGADLNSQRRHRRHRGDRGAQRWGWSVEPGQEPISRGVHLPATMARHHGPDRLVVAGQQRRPGGIPEVPKAVGRAHDVGEQQRLHPTRHRDHLPRPCLREAATQYEAAIAPRQPRILHEAGRPPCPDADLSAPGGGCGRP